MQTHLTQEEYNSINNASTLDELLNIKNQILASSIVSENNSVTTECKVLVRCLSKEEYNKYLINSTCGGAITKNSESVFHRDIHPQITNTFSIHDRLNIRDPGYYPTYNGAETMKYYEEIIENNIEHYVVFANSYSYHTQTRCKQGGMSNAFDRMLDKRNKNYTYVYEQTQLHASSSFSNAYLTINYYEYICYRPIFTYKDNNKSNNIYY